MISWFIPKSSDHFWVRSFPLLFRGQFSPHLGCGVVSPGGPSATPIFFPTTSGWFELSHLKHLHQIELCNPNWRQVKIPKTDWKSPPRWCLIPSLLPFWFAFKLYSFQSLLRYPRNPTGKLHSSLPAECLGIFYHNPVRSLPNLSPVNGLIFGVASSKFLQRSKKDVLTSNAQRGWSHLLVCLMTQWPWLSSPASTSPSSSVSGTSIPEAMFLANHLRNRLGHKDVVLLRAIQSQVAHIGSWQIDKFPACDKSSG